MKTDGYTKRLKKLPFSKQRQDNKHVNCLISSFTDSTYASLNKQLVFQISRLISLLKKEMDCHSKSEIIN